MNEIFCDYIIVFTTIENRHLFKLNDFNERKIDYQQILKEQLGKTTAIVNFAIRHKSLSVNKQQMQPTRFFLYC